MHSTPQFWPMRVRALLTNGPTNELLEGEKVVEGTDKEGRERTKRGRWAADTTADGKIDGTCMNERARTAGGHRPTARRSADMGMKGTDLKIQDKRA